MIVVVVVGVLVAAAAAVGAVASPTTTVQAPTTTGLPTSSATMGQVLEVRTGVATVDELLATKSARRRTGGYVFLRPINVFPGATLILNGIDARLAGGVLPATIRVGGTLAVTDSRLSGGRGARDQLAEIAVDAGGSLRVASSRIVRLGTGENHPGILVRGTGARATIVDSDIRQNYRGLVANDAARVSIVDSSVSASLDSGVVVNGSCHSFISRGTTSSGNHADGFALDNTCKSARIADGNADRNGESGVDVGGATRVKVMGLDAWGNRSGITSHDGARLEVASATLSANREDGITMNALFGSLRVVGSRITHNVRAGVSISDGVSTVGPGNVITGNDTGVRLVDQASSVRAAGNVVRGNVRDGFSLAAVTGIEILNNRIVANGDAAFSVRQAGDAASFVDANTVKASPTDERTRAEDASESP
jgi:hypothetical protein